MKRRLILALALALLLVVIPIRARAEETVTITASGTCGDGVYYKRTSDGTLTIYGSGAMTDYASTTAGTTNPFGTSFTKLVVEEGITHIGNYAFWEQARYSSSTYPVTGCVSVSLPSTLVSIGNGAFLDFSCAVELPSGLKTIGNSAFQKYKGTSLIIPDSVASIGSAAFGSSALETVTIGSGVTSIGSNVFANNSNLTSVTVKAVVPPVAGSGMFTGVPDILQIYVPDVPAYEAADGWADYAAWIVGGVSSGGGAGSSGGSTGGSSMIEGGSYYLTVTHTSLDDYYLNTDLQFWAYWSFAGSADTTIDRSVTWSMSGASSSETFIDENGLLHIGEYERNLYLTVYATSVALPDLKGTSVIKITKMTEEEANIPTEPTSDAAVLDAIADLEDDVSNVQNSVDQVGEAVETLPDQITSGMSDLMDQEQQEAQTQGETAIDDIIEIVPDHSEDFLAALDSLVTALSYVGTTAILETPEIVVPGIPGLYEGFTVLEPQEVNFETWFDNMPGEIMALVRALFDIAIVFYCAKELLALIGGFVNGWVGFDKGLEDYNE